MNNLKAKSAISLFLALILTVTMAVPSFAAGRGEPASSTNVNYQEYINQRRWSQPVNSCLYENSSGGLTRVEYTGDEVVVEDYDSQFKFQSGRTIQMELPIWGGFFAGETYNFIVFGQDNSQKDSSREVYRIVKYSKNWERLDSCSLNGSCTTAKPFDAGSLRCAEYGGYLYIHSCHEMFDGHQSNLMLNVRESDMRLTDLWTTAYNINYGNVSHSFNQFILIDQDANIVTMDHGDSLPRGAILCRYKVKAGQDLFHSNELNFDDFTLGGNWVEYTKVQSFPGSGNDTGATIGGFAETSRGYVTAYSYSGLTDPAALRDIYLGFTSKNGLESSSVRVTVSMDAATPQLVSTGLDGGYIMWQVYNKYGYLDSNLYYARYDANGNVGAAQVASISADLSDCAPIVKNGKIVWYVTENSAPIFYVLDPVSNSVSSYPYNGESNTGVSKPTSTENIAYSSTQTVLVDGRPVEFQMYALKDEHGNDTNYVKLRDVAHVLNGTPAQFSIESSNVGWYYILAKPGQPYTDTGSEMSTPFSGNRGYEDGNMALIVSGIRADIESFMLKDDSGGGYNYFKLRDLGSALGFKVDWNAEQGVIVETSNASAPSKLYTPPASITSQKIDFTDPDVYTDATVFGMSESQLELSWFERDDLWSHHIGTLHLYINEDWVTAHGGSFTYNWYLDNDDTIFIYSASEKSDGRPIIDYLGNKLGNVIITCRVTGADGYSAEVYHYVEIVPEGEANKWWEDYFKS